MITLRNRICPKCRRDLITVADWISSGHLATDDQIHDVPAVILTTCDECRPDIHAHPARYFELAGSTRIGCYGLWTPDLGIMFQELGDDGRFRHTADLPGKPASNRSETPNSSGEGK